MAAFRKFLSATKSKMKTPNIKFERSAPQGQGAVGGSPEPVPEEEDEDFQVRKQQWQDELDEMSEFLLIKSTEEQKEDGVVQPVDTAYVDEKDGMPVLKAVFDVHHFKPDDIHLTVDENQLAIEARCVDDRDDAVFRKTMIRKIDLPKYVDHKMMHCDLSKDGRILTIEMPFHLPPQKKPDGPNVVPILDGPNGQRRICLGLMLGPEFTPDDIKVETSEKRLEIVAGYNEDVGQYGKQVSSRNIRREYLLPETIEVDAVRHAITSEGRLLIEILLKMEKPIKCEVTTEELS